MGQQHLERLCSSQMLVTLSCSVHFDVLGVCVVTMWLPLF